ILDDKESEKSSSSSGSGSDENTVQILDEYSLDQSSSESKNGDNNQWKVVPIAEKSGLQKVLRSLQLVLIMWTIMKVLVVKLNNWKGITRSCTATTEQPKEAEDQSTILKDQFEAPTGGLKEVEMEGEKHAPAKEVEMEEQEQPPAKEAEKGLEKEGEEHANEGKQKQGEQ
ncbi:hypothetical protein FRX31_032397, partial [Thalictrum thalictroides]